MATGHVELVLHRLTDDVVFRHQYCQDPDGTLARYLTPQEIQSLKSGDHLGIPDADAFSRLQELTAALCGTEPRS